MKGSHERQTVRDVTEAQMRDMWEDDEHCARTTARRTILPPHR